MKSKHIIICIIVAALVGAIMGGISKLFDIDFGAWPFAIAPLVFIVSAGVVQLKASKSKK